MEDYFVNISNLKITCAICYLTFDDKRKIITLDCGHFFCNFCLMRLNEDGGGSESNSKSKSEFKCSICRAMNTKFNYLNDNVVRCFNDYVSGRLKEEINKKEDTNKRESFYFCKECKIIIENEEPATLTSCNTHEIIYRRDFLKIVEGIFYSAKLFFSTNNVKEIASNVYSNYAKSLDLFKGVVPIPIQIQIPRDIIVNCLRGYFTKEAKCILKSVEDSEYEKRQNLRRIHNFKKQLKLLNNPLISKHLLENIIKNKEDQKRFIPCFIESTKTLAIFDLSFLDITTYVLKDLSFNFNKTCCIEYDQTTEKFFFISRAFGNYPFLSGKSTIWVYMIKNDELKSIHSLDIPLIDHRSIIIKDKLFILGGRNFSNINNDYKCYDTIHSMDKHSYKFSKSIHVLSYPRANFGLNYTNNQLYLCFGVTDEGRYLNNIEIITMYDNSCTKFISRVVNLDLGIGIDLCLKNIGVLVNCDKMIILGGEGNNSKFNSVIYTLDLSDNFKLIDSFQSKEIVSGSFTNYGICFNSIYGFISNHTDVSEIPHVYLYSESNHKWSCHGIDIY